MKRPGEVDEVVVVGVAFDRAVCVVDGGKTVVVVVDRSDVEVEDVEVLGDPHAARSSPTPTVPMKQRTRLGDSRGGRRTPSWRSMNPQHSERFEGTA